MKRICALFLGLILLLSALSSCAARPEKHYSDKISVSSSDAEDCAVWLTDRLGESLRDRVYISVGDSAGFDMSSFENDGYILKRDGNGIVIAAKTSVGADIAVRKYANAVDLGKGTDFNITYHEGYRIKKLTLAGRDISEYTVVYPESDPELRSSANSYMQYAAADLQRLIAKACGASLALVCGESDASPRIELRRSEELGLHGYRYFFEGDSLIIEGGSEDGCLNGVYRFLENECGWESLSGGDSLLHEAEHIDVPADTESCAVPAFDYFRMANSAVFEDFETDRSVSTHPYGIISYANHSDLIEGNPSVQICYTNENKFMNVCDNVEAFIRLWVSAGLTVGKDLLDINLGQSDNGTYCRCADCMKVIKEEGSVSGVVIRWMNALAENMEERDPEYAKLKYKCFAYFGSQIPCKTHPAENVWVTFAMDWCCVKHTLTGEDCRNRFPVRAVTEQPTICNDDFARWVREWCDMSDNIYIWFYTLECHLQRFSVFDILYDNVRYFRDCGVKGLMWEHDDSGFGFMRLDFQLVYELIWNTDMTRGEFDALKDHLFEREYGDGYTYILEYIDILQQAQLRSDVCWDSWAWEDYNGYGYAKPNGYYMRDDEYYADNFDLSAELLERAVTLAGSARQEDRAKRMTVHMYYEGCYSSYFRALDEGNAAEIGKIKERYSLMIDRIIEAYKNKGTPTYLGYIGEDDVTVFSLSEVKFPKTIEEMSESWARDYLPKGRR